MHTLERRYEMSSTLQGVSVDRVWNRVNSWEGVNDELGPLVQMSVPHQYPQVSDIPADGECHFSSKVLLLGVIPIDVHSFSLRDIEPPHFFDECSENKMMRVWEHKRTVMPVEGGVTVTDYCGFEPRIAILGGLLLSVYRFIFRTRHRRLRKHFADNV